MSLGLSLALFVCELAGFGRASLGQRTLMCCLLLTRRVDRLSLLRCGVGVPHKLGGFREKSRRRPGLQLGNHRSSVPGALLRPALSAARGEPWAGDVLRRLVRLQQPSDGVHRAVDLVRLLAKGAVEVHHRITALLTGCVFAVDRGPR
ncbi:hypothetical protein [Streptomyces sp. enrichment culture]|uniref:hypothetical protein n=1 Tax=Streptomyces sp. enrichment culture TaxID=1795815 RepID=UPI003F560936